MRNGAKKFIASIAALALAVSLAAGGVFAWLNLPNGVCQIRIGLAQVSAAATLDDAARIARSENAAAQLSFTLEADGAAHDFAIEQLSAGTLHAELAVSAEEVARAKQAGAVLEIGGSVAHTCDFAQAEAESGVEVALGVWGDYTLTLTGAEGFALEFAVVFTAA